MEQRLLDLVGDRLTVLSNTLAGLASLEIKTSHHKRRVEPILDAMSEELEVLLVLLLTFDTPIDH